MQTISATEAKARLAELLRTVERGETVAITRHGEAIAHVVPVQASESAERAQAMADFLRIRDKWKPAGMSVEEILRARHEGHRL